MARKKAHRKKLKGRMAPEPKEGCLFDRCPGCGSTDIKWTGKEYVCMACGLILTKDLKDGIRAEPVQRPRKPKGNANMIAWAGICFMVIGPVMGVIEFLPVGAALFVIGMAMLKKRRK